MKTSSLSALFFLALSLPSFSGAHADAELKPATATETTVNGDSKTKSPETEVKKEAGQTQTTPLPEWEIRTAPVAFLAKWLTADLSYTLNKNFSLGPSLIIYNGPKHSGYDDFLPDHSGYAIGMNGMYYFRTIERRTGYLSLHLYYDKFTDNEVYSNVIENSKFSGFKGTVAWGFRWRMAGWLTMLLGGGLEYRHRTEYRVEIYDDRTVKEDLTIAHGVPFIEYKIGVLF